VRTLVIDSNRDRRDMLVEQLSRRHYYEVEAFELSETAVEVHTCDPADLIILGGKSSAIDCASLCLRLREVRGGEDTVILVIVDAVRPGQLIEVLYAGANDYLVEPVDADQLGLRLMLAERAHAAATKNRAILDALPDMVLRLARDGTLLDFRANLAEPPARLDRVVGRQVADVMPPEFAEPSLELIKKTLDERAMHVLEYRLEQPPEIQHFEARFVGCGENQVLAIVRNITERKEHERIQAQLLKSQKLESMGVLAGGIAHDFNNLLTGILGNAALALRHLTASSPAYGRAEDIRASAERAAGLTRQILAYSGQGSFAVQKISLSDHVDEIAHLLASTIPKHVALETDLARDLPPIEADTSQIQQLVMNLVVNGAEAIEAPAGRVSLTTSVLGADADGGTRDLPAGLAPGGYVLLEVVDTGCGVDDKTRLRMFDPFFTTKASGRGLGLAAVLGIVRSHRATLEVTSELGSGTTFRIYFPVSTGPLPDKREQEIEDLSGSGLVLVVDDEKLVRDFARNSLREFGYSVVAAENGQDAVDVFERLADEVVLVLIDMAMPVMGGEETLRIMRRLRPDVRILLTSGFDETEARRRLRDEGATTFLQKPFTPEQLARKVKAALQGEA